MNKLLHSSELISDMFDDAQHGDYTHYMRKAATIQALSHLKNQLKKLY